MSFRGGVLLFLLSIVIGGCASGIHVLQEPHGSISVSAIYLIADKQAQAEVDLGSKPSDVSASSVRRSLSSEAQEVCDSLRTALRNVSISVVDSPKNADCRLAIVATSPRYSQWMITDYTTSSPTVSPGPFTVGARAFRARFLDREDNVIAEVEVELTGNWQQRYAIVAKKVARFAKKRLVPARQQL